MQGSEFGLGKIGGVATASTTRRISMSNNSAVSMSTDQGVVMAGLFNSGGLTSLHLIGCANLEGSFALLDLVVSMTWQYCQ